MRRSASEVEVVHFSCISFTVLHERPMFDVFVLLVQTVEEVLMENNGPQSPSRLKIRTYVVDHRRWMTVRSWMLFTTPNDGGSGSFRFGNLTTLYNGADRPETTGTISKDRLLGRTKHHKWATCLSREMQVAACLVCVTFTRQTLKTKLFVDNASRKLRFI